MLALLTFLALSAQDVEVPETIVTAPRAEGTATTSTARVTLLDAEDLARTGARSLPQAIGLAAGVWIQETNLGGGSPFIRGLTGNQVLILVDGVRLNDSTTRLGPNQALNTISTAIVDRVEVIRGPASVLYGSDAIGGVISIWTKRNRPRAGGGWRGGVESVYRSDVDGARTSVDVGHADERQGWVGIGNLQRWDDLESADGRQDFTGYDSWGLFGSWERELGDGDNLRLTARVHRDDDVPRTDKLVTGFGQTQPSDVRHEFIVQQREVYQLTWSHEMDGTFADRMQMRLAFKRYEEQLRRQVTGSTTLRKQRDVVEGGALGVDWKKLMGEDHLLTWGLDVDYDEVDSTRTDVDLITLIGTPKTGNFQPDARYASFGLFVQDEIFSFEPFDVTAGARYSYYDFSMQPSAGREDGNFDAVTASVQVARDVFESSRATFTVAQGFRAPNLDDLGKDGSFAGGTELANPDLDPERSLSVELALDTRGAAWSAGVALFYTEIDDLIGRELVDPGLPGDGDETFMRENIGDAALWGAEGQWRHRLGGLESPFAIDLRLTFTRGREYDVLDPSTGEEVDGLDFRRIPPLFGTVALDYAPRAIRHHVSWARLALRFADSQDHLNPQDVTDPRIDPDGTGGWAVVDLDVGGPLSALGEGSTWHVGLVNLFDESYRVHGSGIDGPGRGVVVGLHLSR